MADFLSPGVAISEIDLTTVIPSVGTSIGAHAGHFNWGPIDEIVTISNETQLVDRFGYPDAANSSSYISFFSAANFLNYSNNLKVIRSQGVGVKNASKGDGTPSGNIGYNQIATITANAGSYINVNSYLAGNIYLTLTPATGPWSSSANAFIVANTSNGLILSITLASNGRFVPTQATPSATWTYVAGGNPVTGGTNATFTVAMTTNTTPLYSNASSVLIKNETDYVSNWRSGTGSGASDAGPFVAKFAGSIGNSLRYSMMDANSALFSSWSYANNFSSAPGTSQFVSRKTNNSSANDELHLVVIDEDGLFTGIPGNILEKYSYLSRAIDAQNSDGSSNYYKEVINRQSKYIRWVSDPSYLYLTGSNVGGVQNVYSGNTITTSYPVSTSTLSVSLGNGVDGTPGSSNVTTSYSLLNNQDEVDVGLIVTGRYDSTVISTLRTLAESRKDCMVFFSPQQTSVVNNYGNETGALITDRNAISTSSYLFMDSGWKYQYDKYNDQYIWIPCNADVAGIVAKTDSDRDPWFSPGGLNRGFIKNIVKLAYNPSKTDRDVLYNRQINPVVSFSGEGTVLFGDRTLLDKPSAFDRINVRRLFITLEKAISKAAKYSLFEFNDTFTRSQFVSLVEPYLRDVQGRRGITDFRVVCDETNNTSEVIDKNQFVGDIYIKPTRSINFIQLNFVAVRSGVSFDEIVGRF